MCRDFCFNDKNKGSLKCFDRFRLALQVRNSYGEFKSSYSPMHALQTCGVVFLPRVVFTELPKPVNWSKQKRSVLGFFNMTYGVTEYFCPPPPGKKRTTTRSSDIR